MYPGTFYLHCIFTVTISKTETGARCKQTNARAMHIILDPKFFAVDSTSQHFTLLKISFIRHGSRTKKTWISFIRHGFSRPYVTPVRHGYVSYYWPRVGEISICACMYTYIILLEYECVGNAMTFMFFILFSTLRWPQVNDNEN